MFMYLDELKVLKQLTAPDVLFRPKSILFVAKRNSSLADALLRTAQLNRQILWQRLPVQEIRGNGD